MAGNQIDPKYIYISFDGYTINPDEFGDADIEITAGGENSDVIKGKSGGHETVWKWDKIDQLTFTLFSHSASSYKLENYHNQHKQIENLIVKDTNPNRQRTWTSTAANVKSYDAVALTGGNGYAFTIECEDDFEIA